jgi:hypothetical protein
MDENDIGNIGNNDLTKGYIPSFPIPDDGTRGGFTPSSPIPAPTEIAPSTPPPTQSPGSTPGE